MRRSALAILLLSLAAPSFCRADDPANGWRGNGTGRWPDSKAPLEWYRVPKGVITDLRARADRPDAKSADGLPLAKGIVRDWLVLGPFPVKDSVQDFGQAQLAEEATVQPAIGDPVGALTWKAMTAKLDDRWEFGPAGAPFADVGTVVGYNPNQVAYAHTYLYLPKGGTVRAVVDHMFGMKAWVNGKEVYSSPQRKVSLGSYYPLSRTEFGTDGITPSPRFDLELKPGWNRLLLKISSFTRKDDAWRQQNFSLRLQELPGVAYDSKNILWMTELPHRTNASPIVAGNRVFVMSEPDELICLDKETGKILWSAASNYYELLTPAERQALPEIGKKVDPLVAELKTENDFIKRTALRAKIQKTLSEIDFDRFAWKADGHFQAHFGIVGYTTPSPVTDGKYVWVWCGNGVAACYDLDGKRQWITRMPTNELSYSSAPALADGTFAVFQHKLIGLDVKTGRIRWEQKKIDFNNGGLLSARIAGVQVFVNSLGHVVRASDGKLLYRERDRAGGAPCWGPPVVVGDKIYLSRYGPQNLLVLDFTGATGDEWEATRLQIQAPDGINRGKSVSRSSCGSPLVVDDMVYMVDIYSTLYAFDLKAKKLAYHHDTELNGLFHYNAVPVAASPTLIGKHIVIQDNQGVALVLEPGRTFKQVGKNHIATQLDRFWPMPAQETIGYSAPVPDGNRLYLRGERHLYCIGEK
jgi:outer membrane protein assembly factor BamB